MSDTILALSGAVSIHIADTDDESLEAFCSRVNLVKLRKLSVLGVLTDRSLRAICEADLPLLEHLDVTAPELPNPCEEAVSHGWDGQITHAKRSVSGEALEGKYGWKKYFHAASRFWEFPPSLSTLDILPSLPDDLQARKRFWD